MKTGLRILLTNDFSDDMGISEKFGILLLNNLATLHPEGYNIILYCSILFNLV